MHRNASRLGVIDGFERLRHDAVVGRDDEHHDIGDLRAASTHAGERLVTGSIDKDDLAAVPLDVIGADMLRDAAGFAAGHIGLADRIEQRSLTVIDVAHDSDHGGAPDQVFVSSVCSNVLGGFFFVADLIGGSAKVTRQLFGELHIESLVDGGENFLSPPAS